MTQGYQCKPTNLLKKRVGQVVEYGVSYNYNGGIVKDGKWYTGYDVPPPLLPEGTEIYDMGFGLQFNACPPLATGRLVKKGTP